MTELTAKRINESHYNIPQLRFALAMAQTNILLWGRRTGKTEGALSNFYLTNVLKMPRSNGFIYASTYEQILTRTLPPLIAGWERFGYKENVHFWIRKFPPGNLNLPKPFRTPLKPDYFISWFNGSGIYIVSQDVTASINGVATQYGGGDEAKFLKVDKLREEALLTFSGGEQYRSLSNYLSTCFSSDMPTDRDGSWLFDFEKLMDVDVIEKIIQLQQSYNYMLNEIIQNDYSPVTKSNRYWEMEKIDRYLNELRKGAVYYSEASTLDNIHVLGVEPIRAFARELSNAQFNASVLNKRVRGSQLGFYAALSMDHHGYDDPNNAFIDSLPDVYKQEYTKDCRWNNDLLHNKPIDHAIDINAAIKCVVVDQMNNHTNIYKRVSSHFVLHPYQLEHLADEFDRYYKYFHLKVTNFIYDQTMISESGTTGTSYADDWIQLLRYRGWSVNPIYIGAVPPYTKRYKLWNKVLLNTDSKLPRFMFNKTNAYSWYISACEAGAIDKGHKIEKDKRSEKDKNFPQEEATHLSDAGDTSFWYNMTIHDNTDQIFVDIIS